MTKQGFQKIKLTVLVLFTSWAAMGQESVSDSVSIEPIDPNQVTSSQFNTGSIHQMGTAIQGLVPGLWAFTSNGDLNLPTQLRVRGLTPLGESVYERTGPTISISGLKGVGLHDIDPYFIGNVSVVKDGQLSQYGMQGAFGALELQPQQGQGPLKVSYHSFWSREKELITDPALTAESFLRNSSWNEGANTDWRDEIRQNGNSWVNQLSVSGANKMLDYYVGVSRRDATGIQRYTGFDQTSVFMNVGSKLLGDRLNIRAIGMNSLTNRTLGFPDVYEYADRYNPTSPIRQPNGDYHQPDWFSYFNPVALINENSNETEENRSLGILTADLHINDWSWGNRISVYDKKITGLTQSTGLSAYRGGFVSEENSVQKQQIFSYQSQLLFKKQIGDLGFQLATGIESQDVIHSDSSHTEYPTDSFSSFIKHRVYMLAYFSNLDVSWGDFKSDISFRREGSSALSPGQRWSDFYSVSFSYNFSGLESFRQFEVYTRLGTSGMTPFQSGMTKRLIVDNPFPWYPVFDQNPTDELSNISSQHFDLGLNMISSNGKWWASLSYFSNHLKDFWYREYDATTLDYNTWKNTGEISTKGLEIAAGTGFKVGSIIWDVSGIFASQNTVIKDAGLIDGFQYSSLSYGCGSGTIHLIATGDDLGNFYGPKFIGFSRDQGNRLWILDDFNGDGSAGDYRDYQPIGNGLPDWTLSMQHQLQWKRFTVAMNFRGVFGHDVVNFRKLHLTPITDAHNMLASYTETELQDITNRHIGWNSYFVEKGSFLRLQVLTFNYQINTRAKFIDDLNVYMTFNNVFTISGYDGNPEPELVNNSFQDFVGGARRSNNWTPGIDRHDVWPQSKSFSIGLVTNF